LFNEEEQSKLVQTYWQSVFCMKITNLSLLKPIRLQQSSYRRFESKCSCQNHKTTLFKQLKLVEKLLFEILLCNFSTIMHSIKKRRWIDHQIVVSFKTARRDFDEAPKRQRRRRRRSQQPQQQQLAQRDEQQQQQQQQLDGGGDDVGGTTQGSTCTITRSVAPSITNE
jgi:hypothetical protein